MENRSSSKNLHLVEIVTNESYLNVDNPDTRSTSPRSLSPPRSIKGLNLFRAISKKLGKNRKSKEVKYNSSDDEDSNSSLNSNSPRSRCSNTKYNRKKEVKICHCGYIPRNETVDDIFISFTPKDINITYSPVKNDKKYSYHFKTCRVFKSSTKAEYTNRHKINSSGSDYSSNEDSSASNDNDHTTARNDSSTSSSGSNNESSAIVRKVFKSLSISSGRSLSCSSISKKQLSCSERRESVSSKEKDSKKSPKRILRQPVSYTYVRGMSGLPTHRVISNRPALGSVYRRGIC